MKSRQLFGNMTKKQMIWAAVAVLSFLLFLVITFWMKGALGKLSEQQAAGRWDAKNRTAQVSCFFAEDIAVDEMQLMNFGKQLEKQLLEVLSQEETMKGADARLFMDAYSSEGTITLASEKGTLDNVNAVGIGGDFFWFHPLQLLSGQYFSGADLMKDSVIIDEEAAWQLFGSTDIAGKSVMIGNVPHYISGVIKRQDGKFAESAGLGETVVYVSCESLSAYGKTSGISCYEVVAPNPVKNFVYTAVKEKLGVEESDMLVVENSSRYSVESMIPVLLDFGSRSMQNRAIQFPYWENVARGYEDIRALVLVFQIILVLIPTVIIAVSLFMKWKRRTWTVADIWKGFSAGMERHLQTYKTKKNKVQKEEEL